MRRACSRSGILTFSAPSYPAPHTVALPAVTADRLAFLGPNSKGTRESFSTLDFIFFHVCFECTCVYQPRAWCLWRSEGGIRSPRIWILGKLLTTMWVLGIKPRCPARVTSAPATVPDLWSDHFSSYTSPPSDIYSVVFS